MTKATELTYDETVRALRAALAEVSRHTRAFAVRSRARPRLVSARTWAELAEIEAVLAFGLEETLQRELHVAPQTLLVRARTGARLLAESLRGEEGLVRALFGRARTHPVRDWRAATPQLESTLWPFFVARTDYLANTLALALNEPAPFPLLLWHPGRHEFTR